MSLTALSAKLAAGKSILASGSLAGVLAFAISELSTGNLWIAVSLSALSSIAVAWFASRPKVITANSLAAASAIAARTAAEVSVVAEWAGLLGRTTEIFEAQLSRLREKNDRHEKKEALLHVSKHNVAGAYQAAVFHIQGLHELLRDNNITDFPLFSPQTIKQLTEHEDRETLKLFSLTPDTEIPK